MHSIRFLWLVLCAALITCAPAGTPASISDDTGQQANLQNNLIYAVAWKQTAAEYRALYHQGFNVARLRVQQALDAGTASKPLAVISDLDETLVLAHDYWGYLINQQQDFFDDESWDLWVASNRVEASPGALEFLRFCAENSVEVFYVTNRDQGETTNALALTSLQSLGFPYADEAHLTVLRDTSNKELVQNQIREEYEVITLLGDNLNDFSRRYYVTDVIERQQLEQEDSERFGADFILFPNPTDGHWIRAIFGESEPPASADNRQRFRDAATTTAWSR